MQNIISKFSPNEKKILYFTLIIVLFAFFDRLFLGPITERVGEINSEIAQQRVSIANDLRILEYKDRILEDNSAYTKYFTEDIPEEGVIKTELLGTIERLAREAGINLIKSSPSEIKEEKRYIDYYANMDCLGSLDKVISFMHLINSSDEMLKVVRFSLTPKRGTQSDVNVSIGIVKRITNLNMNNEISSM